MAGRIGGPIPPEPTRGGPRGPAAPDPTKFKEEMQKVEEVQKVGEVDLDQPRKQPYYAPQTDDDDEDEETVSSDDALPQSEDFWEACDLPDDPPQAPSFEETSRSSPIGATPEKKKKTDKKKSTPEPWALEAQSAELSGKKTKKAKETPAAALPPPPFLMKKEEKPTSDPTNRSRMATNPDVAMPLMPKQLKDEKEGQKEQRFFEEPEPVHPPDPLPTSIQQAAAAVEPPATSNLSVQTAALFYQMVGTILYMASATPGISLTEVTLNSSAFEKSPFFGAKITIERYSTAANSFNIRLTGSAEAVKTFNANLSTLSAAFSQAYDSGKIKFRIGRIEASYAADRPLIRRAQSARDKHQGRDKQGGK